MNAGAGRGPRDVPFDVRVGGADGESFVFAAVLRSCWRAVRRIIIAEAGNEAGAGALACSSQVQGTESARLLFPRRKF